MFLHFSCENNVLEVIMKLSELRKASSFEQLKVAFCLHDPFIVASHVCMETQQRTSADHGLCHLRYRACFHVNQERMLPVPAYPYQKQSTKIFHAMHTHTRTCRHARAHRTFDPLLKGSFSSEPVFFAVEK